MLSTTVQAASEHLSRPTTRQSERPGTASAAIQDDPEPIPVAPAPGRRLDVNTATAEDFMEIPGMTTVMAEAIVNKRDTQGRYETAEQVARVQLPGAGLIGKKVVSKWLPWLTAVPWHSDGSMRIGCWNLENLCDKTTVDPGAKFDCDKWLNAFVKAVVKNCDLLVLLEVDIENSGCERLKERFLRHEELGAGWCWVESQPGISPESSSAGSAKGVVYVFRSEATVSHPAVTMVSPPQPHLPVEHAAYPLRNLPIFQCGGLVVAPLTVHLTHCRANRRTYSERSELLEDLPWMLGELSKTWRRRPNVMILGDFGDDTPLQIKMKYHPEESAETMVGLINEETWKTRKVSSDNFFVPRPLGPWTPTPDEQQAMAAQAENETPGTDTGTTTASAEGENEVAAECEGAPAEGEAAAAEGEAEGAAAADGAPAEGAAAAEGAPAEGAPAEDAPAEGAPAEGAPAEQDDLALKRPGIKDIEARALAAQEELKLQLAEKQEIEDKAKKQWAAATKEDKPELEPIYDKATEKRRKVERKLNLAGSVRESAEKAVKLHEKAVDKQEGKIKAVAKLTAIEEGDPKHKGVKKEILEWKLAEKDSNNKAQGAYEAAEAALAALKVKEREAATVKKAVPKGPQANGDRRLVSAMAVTTGLNLPGSVSTQRWSKRLGRRLEDHLLIVAEYSTMSGKDTPTMRQLDSICRMNGFDPDAEPDPFQIFSLATLPAPSAAGTRPQTAHTVKEAGSRPASAAVGTLEQWA